MKRKKTQRKIKIKLLTDKQLVEMAEVNREVIEAKVILPSDVVTADWVRRKCQFGCDGYGQCLVCPPYTPTPKQTRKILDTYNRAVLIHFSPHADVKAIVAELEREIFLKGAWKAFGLGAGPCYFCSRCNLEEKVCRHADRARPAMEACGIDVFSTVKKAGFPIEVVRTRQQRPNYYGLVLVD